MTERNRLKKEAHTLAARIWEWEDKRQRNRMYKWLHENKKHFNGHWHIRHMDKH